MKTYNNDLQFILENGTEQENRTGINTIMFPTLFERYDVSKLFPAVTTKKLAWKGVRGEVIGFLRPVRSAADMRELGCMVWDKNANDPGKEGSRNAWLDSPFRKGTDDLGDVYGAMWREWPGFKMIPAYGGPDGIYNKQRDAIKKNGWEWQAFVETVEHGAVDVYTKTIDMVGDCIRKLILEPTNRRILFHAWNPAALDQMALPPCHLLYQFLPNIAKRELSLSMTQRSADFFLGIPFNIASAALLLHIVARLTGFKPKFVNLTFNDAHIYVNALDQVKEQISREPYPLPTLKIDDAMPSFEKTMKAQEWGYKAALEGYDDRLLREGVVEHAIAALSTLNPDWFTLENYQHHEPIRAEMAV